MTLEERFWPKVDRRGPDDCWPWTGARAGHGYGHIRDGDRVVPAHRVAYELLVGPIPVGLQIDHLCRCRHCVNPAHMEPVTARENILRGEGRGAKAARMTHCPRGHELSGANLYVYSGKRQCRRCTLDRQRSRRSAA